MITDSSKKLKQNQFNKLNTIKELKELLDTVKELRLYGAGHYLNLFLQGIEELDRHYLDKIKCILVSDVNGNFSKIRGIPVIDY